MSLPIRGRVAEELPAPLGRHVAPLSPGPRVDLQELVYPGLVERRVVPQGLDQVDVEKVVGVGRGGVLGG